jgi:hypothetical protein
MLLPTETCTRLAVWHGLPHPLREAIDVVAY